VGVNKEKSAQSNYFGFEIKDNTLVWLKSVETSSIRKKSEKNCLSIFMLDLSLKAN
jgi:hypothetical protein